MTSIEILLTLYQGFPQDCFSSDQGAYNVRENKQFKIPAAHLDNVHLTQHQQQAASSWESSLVTKSHTRTSRKRSVGRLCEDIWHCFCKLLKTSYDPCLSQSRVLTLQSTFISLQDKVISLQWNLFKMRRCLKEDIMKTQSDSWQLL